MTLTAQEIGDSVIQQWIRRFLASVTRVADDRKGAMLVTPSSPPQ